VGRKVVGKRICEWDVLFIFDLIYPDNRIIGRTAKGRGGDRHNVILAV
jgi:hypothetical protein